MRLVKEIGWDFQLKFVLHTLSNQKLIICIRDKLTPSRAPRHVVIDPRLIISGPLPLSH